MGFDRVAIQDGVRGGAFEERLGVSMPISGALFTCEVGAHVCVFGAVLLPGSLAHDPARTYSNVGETCSEEAWVLGGLCLP